MVKLGLFASVTAIIAALVIASTNPAVAKDGDCTRKEFKTKLVKQACEKGGQALAKEMMQAFNKEKKISSCNKCHDKLKPEYTLRTPPNDPVDGLKIYNDLKGDDSAASKAVLAK
jgi:hypothetical protein